jgi:hypothetical protein
MIMNTIADAIDGNVGSKIDRSIAIDPKRIAQKSNHLAYRNSLTISRSNRFYTHSSIRSCLHFVGTAHFTF